MDIDKFTRDKINFHQTNKDFANLAALLEAPNPGSESQKM